MEAIGQLAGGVAHDFNNVLTAIGGNVELALDTLEAQFAAASGLRESLHQIERAAERASALTRQLLAFSRRQVMRMKVLNLNTTLRDLEKMLRRLLTEKIALELVLAADLAATKADAGHLEQVVLNLVVNARDAMPDGGHLTLETANAVLDESYVALHPVPPRSSRRCPRRPPALRGSWVCRPGPPRPAAPRPCRNCGRSHRHGTGSARRTPSG